MSYEELEDFAVAQGLNVKSVPFEYVDGMIIGNNIGIRKDIETESERADILAEEIGHFLQNSGDILDQSIVENRRQERQGRATGYNLRIGLTGIIHALEFGCQNSYEAAEYLGCTERFFNEAISYYRQKYGIATSVGDYTLIFEPSLDLIK